MSELRAFHVNKILCEFSQLVQDYIICFGMRICILIIFYPCFSVLKDTCRLDFFLATDTVYLLFYILSWSLYSDILFSDWFDSGVYVKQENLNVLPCYV